MSLTFSETPLPGVILIEPAVFSDDRGFFLETYHHRKYEAAGVQRRFVQDNHSRSRQNVLRGLHYQLRHPQAKLVYVTTGEIFDVAVDIRKGSDTFGQWMGTHLSEKNRRQLFIPEGFAHGFCVISHQADVVYKCSDFFSPDDDFGLLWSDPTVNIDWPVEVPYLSEKDRQHKPLSEIPEQHLPTADGN
jgi:dTDP-4-dehydrorhamnose 3,5-epimerase